MIEVLVTCSTLQFQLRKEPTLTIVSSGEKLVPVMVTNVPPLKLPVKGDIEVMLLTYSNESALVGTAIESPLVIGKVI